MSCVIPDGAKVKLVNGKIVWHGKEYNQTDCTIGDGVVFTTEVKEIGVDEEEQPKPKKKKTAPKTEQKSVEQTSDNIEIDTNQDTTKDIDMGLPIQAPQEHNPGQGQVQPPVQQQMPVQPQQMQPVQQMQMPVQMPQGLPQGFTVPPQFQQQYQQFQQQFQQPQQLHNEVQHPPADGMDMNMIKTIMSIAGDNPVVLVALIGAYLGFTWMKKMEKIKEKEAENGGQHATACDNDRKNLNSKFTDIDFKVQKIDMLENKVKQMGDVNGRLTKLEENSNGLTFNDTSDLEETLAKVTKKVESLDKKIASLVANAQAPAKVEIAKKPAKGKDTKTISEFLPEEDEE